jgi:hypothetical protein
MKGCPDCDPEGFRANLVAAFGQPVRIAGVEFYASANCPEHKIISPAAFARLGCPAHAPRPQSSEEKP